MDTMKLFLRRFHEILDELDAIAEGEEAEELNAQLEDEIFYMESIDGADADAAEEMGDALVDIRDLLGEYKKLDSDDKVLAQKVLELEMAVQMAERNIT